MSTLALGRPSPRFAGCAASALLFLLAVLIAPSQAVASLVTVGVPGSFKETKGKGSPPDLLSISNEAVSERAIVEILLDLTGSDGAFFDPSDSAFAVTSSDDVGFDAVVGFDLIADDVLRLVFSDFDSGETFMFGVDVDDKRKDTSGKDFAGSLLEPSTGLLLAAGLVVLARRRSQPD